MFECLDECVLVQFAVLLTLIENLTNDLRLAEESRFDIEGVQFLLDPYVKQLLDQFAFLRNMFHSFRNNSTFSQQSVNLQLIVALHFTFSLTFLLIQVFSVHNGE